MKKFPTTKMSQQEFTAMKWRVQGKTYEEIAREVGVDRSRARVLVLRALSRLEEMLEYRLLSGKAVRVPAEMWAQALRLVGDLLPPHHLPEKIL